MKKMIIGILSLACLNSYAITCENEEVTIEVKNNEIAIQNVGENSKAFKEVKDSVWDGHLTGMMTGKGFSLTYENHFGCFRNVKYIGPISEKRENILQVNFVTCGGGSTPDELCFQK